MDPVPNRRAVLALGASGAVLAAVPACAGTMSLRPAFNVEALRAKKGVKAKPVELTGPPAPVVKLAMESKYAVGDEESAQIDQARDERYRAQLQPIQFYTSELTKLADKYAQMKPAPVEVALRAGSWMDAWAQAGALTQPTTDQGRVVAGWETIPVALSWVKIRDARGVSGYGRSIEPWLRGLGAQTRQAATTVPDERSRNNNHLYWAGWSNLSVAMATGDGAAADFARGVLAKAQGQVAANGSLPLELERGPRALQYHNYSLGPLMLMATTFAANGEPSAFAPGSPLMRLADLTLRGLDDPSLFKALNGEEQTLEGIVWRSQLAWLEPYYARTGDKRALTWLGRYRPMRSPRLGGDLTYYYSA